MSKIRNKIILYFDFGTIYFNILEEERKRNKKYIFRDTERKILNFL